VANEINTWPNEDLRFGRPQPPLTQAAPKDPEVEREAPPAMAGGGEQEARAADHGALAGSREVDHGTTF
jgi:hypothetical protein